MGRIVLGKHVHETHDVAEIAVKNILWRGFQFDLHAAVPHKLKLPLDPVKVLGTHNALPRSVTYVCACVRVCVCACARVRVCVRAWSSAAGVAREYFGLVKTKIKTWHRPPPHGHTCHTPCVE